MAATLERQQELVEACKRGNRAAQFEMYQLYSRAMYNICLRMVIRQEDAEDVLQNSFTDIFTKINSYRQESTIGAWIKRIVINNCINHLKRQRLQFQELETYHAQELPDAEHWGNDNQLNIKVINEAIGQLPDGYRIVFNMYALEGYDHEEIGQVLGISEATSKSQYSRAKARLREILSSPQKLYR